MVHYTKGRQWAVNKDQTVKGVHTQGGNQYVAQLQKVQYCKRKDSFDSFIVFTYCSSVLP